MTNLNHWCDPDPERNYFPTVIDPAGRRFDHNHVDHSMCSGEELIRNTFESGKMRWEAVPCECECHHLTAIHRLKHK